MTFIEKNIEEWTKKNPTKRQFLKNVFCVEGDNKRYQKTKSFSRARTVEAFCIETQELVTFDAKTWKKKSYNPWTTSGVAAMFNLDERVIWKVARSGAMPNNRKIIKEKDSYILGTTKRPYRQQENQAIIGGLFLFDRESVKDVYKILYSLPRKKTGIGGEIFYLPHYKELEMWLDNRITLYAKGPGGKLIPVWEPVEW